AYERMLDRYFQNQSATPPFDTLVYSTIGETLAGIAAAPDVNVARSLIQSASMLGGTDAFNNFSVVLHGDVSSEIRSRSEVEALERKMAAWLFMQGRYGLHKIVEDVATYLEYESLSLDILLQGRSYFPENLLATVAEGYEAAASQMPERATSPFALLEQGIANLLNFSKLRKGEKDYTGAISQLQAVVNLIHSSSWRVNISGEGMLSTEHRKLAIIMTDALGMMGGHYRRLSDPHTALSCFLRGSTLERNPVFGIVSSYNSVNSL